jgi:hypothetical protein
VAKAKTVKKALAKTSARKSPAIKPKVAPAKPATSAKAAKAGRSPFSTIDPLPTDAWRLSTIDPAIASSEQAAQLLGLGYPRMFLTTPGDFTGTDEQLRALASTTRIIPRDALSRIYTVYTFPDLKADDLTRAASELLDFSGNNFAMYALECLHGTVDTATAIVDKLEAIPVEHWGEEGDDGERFCNHGGGAAIRGLGFLLWRVPAKARSALRARLEKVHAKVLPAGNYATVKALDEMLHGRVAWERVNAGKPLDLSSLLHVDDDPAFVAAKVLAQLKTQASRDRQGFDIQLGVIAGPKVIGALRASTAKFPSDQKKSIAAQLSLVK